MTAKQRKELVQSIVQGAVRKALRGEKPFQTLSQKDDLIKEFRADVSAIAPLVGVDFDKTVAGVIAEELKI